MAERLADLGARVIEHPVIEITPPEDFSELDAAIDHLGDYAWVVFSSRNGVDALLERMQKRNLDARAFGCSKVAAIGSVTADALAAWRLIADLIPEEFCAESLAADLSREAANKKILLIRASRGREVLAETLYDAGAEVDQVVAYMSRDVTAANPTVLEEITAGRVDWITATSSAIAHAAATLFGEAIKASPKPPRFAAISPLTAAALKDGGYESAAVATAFTADGVIDAILKTK